MAGGDADRLRHELDAEMAKMFQHFDHDEDCAAKLARALDQESTAAALQFALFPCRTRATAGCGPRAESQSCQ